MIGSLNPESLSVRIIVFLLLIGSSLTSMTVQVASVPRPELLEAAPLPSPDVLGYSGIGPTTISLKWTESNMSSFIQYHIQKFDFIRNEWEEIANIPNKNITSLWVIGQEPNSTGYWQVLYQNQTGFLYSNILAARQATVASLSYSLVSATGARFSWTNNATYGGMEGFRGYQLMASVNGGPYYNVSNPFVYVSAQGQLVNDLLPASNYSFYLNTTDQCSGCPSPSWSSSRSNTIRINTPGPLRASAIVSPHSVDVGELVYLSCSSAGGASPYSYSWTFGDGSSGTGANPNHVYNASGMMGVVCTVIDGLGTIANSKAITFTVYVDPFITSFEATPASPDLGQSITFLVSASGGNGSLTYSYAGLPTGCSSTNSSSFSCTPTSSGIYTVMATVLDQGRETATSTLSVSIGPPRLFGLPQAIGLVVILGSGGGIALGGLIGTVFLLRWKKQRRP